MAVGKNLHAAGGNITNGTGLTAGYRLNGKDGPLQTVFCDNDVDILTGARAWTGFSPTWSKPSAVHSTSLRIEIQRVGNDID